MNRLISLFFVIFFLFGMEVYGQIEKKELYERKVESYTKMKRTGFAIAGIGTVATTFGIMQLSRATWETTNTATGTQTTSSSPEAVQGSVGVLIGIPALVTGTVLGIIGATKSKSYNKKLQRLNVGVNYMPQNKGLVITYRF